MTTRRSLRHPLSMLLAPLGIGGLTVPLLILQACGESDGRAIMDIAPDALDGVDVAPDARPDGDDEADAAETAAEDTQSQQDTAPPLDSDDTATPEDADVSVGDGADGDASDTVPLEGAAFELVPIANPVDLTPDGTMALLWDNSGELGGAWSYEVASGELVFEAVVGPSMRTFPTAVSAAFDIAALHGEPVAAGLWSRGSAWRDLGSPFAEGCGLDPTDPKLGDVAGAWDVSDDGAVVVGLAWDGCRTEAFRWFEGGGAAATFKVLESPPGTASVHNNRATVVSDDGRIAAGFVQTEQADRRPVWWSADGTGTMLESAAFPPDAPGEVLSISADGSTMAGIWNQDGFVWTAADGVLVIGRLPEYLPGEPTYPNAIAADGRLVFGGSGSGFGVPAAFVWTAEAGMRRLQDLVLASGLSLPEGLALTNVLAASDDGAVVLGTALDTLTFVQQSFVLTLPIEAYGL